MPKISCVLTTLGYEPDRMALIRKACGADEFIQVDRGDGHGIAAALEEADVALLASDDLDERHLSAPRLRWIHCDHAGLNRSARPEVFEKGLLVTGSAGRSSPALAEHAIFFMLSLAYNFSALYEAQREHRWGIPHQEQLRGLYGKTLGIVGLGHTGKELAARARSLGMSVIGFRRQFVEPPPGVDVVYCTDRGDPLEPLLRESDFVVLAVSLSNATFHLISSHEFELMKPTAYLINVARGEVVDQEALVSALRSERIAGAGLDTTTPEPLPPESPLWEMPRVFITPHLTPQVPDRTGRSLQIILENIERYRSGQPLLNQLMPNDLFTVS